MKNEQSSNSVAALEIYKLHVTKITETSHRRVNISRYYILSLSVLILALSALTKGGNILANDNSPIDPETFNWLIVSFGTIGTFLTWSWILNILGYLRSNSHRYKIAKRLEADLDFDFIEKLDRSQAGESRKESITYFDLAFHELFAPFTFCFAFILLTTFGLWQFSASDIINLYICVALVTIALPIIVLHLKKKGDKND